MNSITKYFPFFLVLYHLAFAFIGYFYVINHHGDASKYWFVGKDLSQTEWWFFLQPGTSFVQLICYPFVKVMHAPFVLGFLMFAAWSSWGFYRLWKLMLELSNGNPYLISSSIILLLLPNIHFWTSLIGKESLLFVPAVFILEAFFRQKYVSTQIVFSFLLIAWVRPHMAFVFLLAYVIAILSKGKIAKKVKLRIVAGTIISVGALVLVLQKLELIRELSWEKIQYVYWLHNFQLKKTNAYVPLEDYYFPQKMFTFYFRPLAFEKSSFLYQVVGIDSLIFLMFVVVSIYAIIRCFKKINWDAFLMFSIILVVLYAAMYVYAYANFGMIIRTKVLVMPVFYMIILMTLTPLLSKGTRATTN